MTSPRDRVDLLREILVSPVALRDSPLLAAEKAAFPLPVLSLGEAAKQARQAQQEEDDDHNRDDSIFGSSNALPADCPLWNEDDGEAPPNRALAPQECAVLARVARARPLVRVEHVFVQHPFKTRKLLELEEVGSGARSENKSSPYFVEIR